MARAATSDANDGSNAHVNVTAPMMQLHVASTGNAGKASKIHNARMLAGTIPKSGADATTPSRR